MKYINVKIYMKSGTIFEDITALDEENEEKNKTQVKETKDMERIVKSCMLESGNALIKLGNTTIDASCIEAIYVHYNDLDYCLENYLDKQFKVILYFKDIFSCVKNLFIFENL